METKQAIIQKLIDEQEYKIMLNEIMAGYNRQKKGETKAETAKFKLKADEQEFANKGLKDLLDYFKSL